MLKKIIMPSAGQTTDTATVTKICVSLGDKVERGQVVAEVETDKATLPVESFATGRICSVCVKEFEVIDAGTLLFTVGDDDDFAAANAAPAVSGTASASEASAASVASAADSGNEIKPCNDADNEDGSAPAVKVTGAPSAQKPSDSAEPVSSESAAPVSSESAAAGASPAMPSAKKLAAELGVRLDTVTPSNGSFIKPCDVRGAVPGHFSAPYVAAPAADFSALRGYISHITDVIGVPGASILIKREHEEVFFCQSGFSNREAGKPITRDAVYYMYSISKVVTCVAALQLFERGGFLLSEPVSDYLPEFKDIGYQRGGYVQPVGHPLLIKDLFTMSSGLTYNLSTANINDASEQTGGRCPTREMVRAFARSPLAFEPSTQWLYGLSHDVLAALVEVISGMRFSEYVKRNIFDPLGMTDSCYHIETVDKNRVATQYRFNDKTRTAVAVPLTNSYVLGPDYESGGAGMISTVDDISRFTDMLACGGIGVTGARILSPCTIELMRTNQLDGTRLDYYHRAFPNQQGYGYGLGVRTLLDRTAGALSPVGEFGWSGAGGAYLLADPQNRLSLFYVQHMLNGQGKITHPRLRNITYAALGL